MGAVLRLVCDFGASPPRERPRVPGTPEREAAARELHAALAAAGWNAWYQNFTGRDYDALEKGSVAAYAGACSAADQERALGLTFSNVGADLGSGGPVSILMAHYESKRNASMDPRPENHTRPVLGANDGASGVGVLVEAARVWGQTHRSDTLRILLVDGEDGFEDCHPLAGSTYYARSLSEAERARIQGVYLLDMVGDPEARFCLASNAPALASRLRTAAQNESVPAIAEAPACGVYDDHTPFTDLDVPAVDLIDFHRSDTPQGFPPYWHTVHDTPDKLSAQRLGEVGRVVVAALG
jgi:Zn-dependent M28 family amino/carboxypeptidase